MAIHIHVQKMRAKVRDCGCGGDSAGTEGLKKFLKEEEREPEHRSADARQVTCPKCGAHFTPEAK